MAALPVQVEDKGEEQKGQQAQQQQEKQPDLLSLIQQMQALQLSMNRLVLSQVKDKEVDAQETQDDPLLLEMCKAAGAVAAMKNERKEGDPVIKVVDRHLLRIQQELKLAQNALESKEKRYNQVCPDCDKIILPIDCERHPDVYSLLCDGCGGSAGNTDRPYFNSDHNLVVCGSCHWDQKKKDFFEAHWGVKIDTTDFHYTDIPDQWLHCSCREKEERDWEEEQDQVEKLREERRVYMAAS